MRDIQALEILILELICKHPSINNTYSLTRFFAKSSVLPDKVYAALKDLVAKEYTFITEIKNTINYYEITAKGKAALDEIDVFGFVEDFTWEIEPSGFIAKIVYLLENKKNLVEVVDSYLLSDGRMIAFIKADSGKLADGITLENFHKRMWRIKQYLQVWGSIDTYEIIQRQEKENTFQYLLEGLGHLDKPEKDDRLKVLPTSANIGLVK
ncbi:MAG: hypothetical protein EOP48_04820 [Sphingobacteriales bacterium]|nr:MAG: hypothetical protein EOP48_04820 [Sphingobacteriales bacterium]